MKRIDFSKKFDKDLRKADIKIKKKFRQRLSFFIKNKDNVLLRNHELKGEWVGYRSINITGDWRAIYEEKNGVVIFVALGTHSQLYG